MGERFKQDEAEERKRARNKWGRASVGDGEKGIKRGRGGQKEKMRRRGKNRTGRQREPSAV